MSYSLAEIDAQCRKAARGAGYPWGLAEEAGRAVRWLEARGMPGAEALAGLLAAQDGCDYAMLRPASLDGIWQAAGGALCPIIAGVTLADHAPFKVPPRLGTVRAPVLLLPFLAAANLWCDESANFADRDDLDFAEVSLTHGPHDLPDPSPASRVIAPDVWAALDRFAHRTYVPATDASRAGAGAGETDND